MEHFRADFPELSRCIHGHPLLYLDTGATALKPLCMIERISDFYRNEYATVNRAVYHLATQATDAYHAARATVAKFIGADKEEEIIFTRGTTDSLNLIAESLKSQLQPGDEILISEMEHHSNIVPWQMVAKQTGAHLRVIPISDLGELQLSSFSQSTKIVAITHISNTLGTINPIKKIVKMAHEIGAVVVCDGAQSAPDTPLDMQELGVDFFAFSGHKTYGPSGIGILYGKLELLNSLAPSRGGGDMIDTVTFDTTTYQAPPLRFEPGTPMIAQAIGLGTSLEYLMQIGMDKIHSHKQKLHTELEQRLQDIPGLQIIGRAKDKAAITSFTIEGIHHLDLGTFLDLEGIACRTGHHCTQPLMQRFGVPGTTRCSLGLYNTEEEIERFVEALKRVLSKLQSF